MDIRIGVGYDIHRLVTGRKLILGGVEIPFGKGLEGHSDADVLLHAMSDAILGALGEKDLGSTFPDTDPACKGMPSKVILKAAYDIMSKKGFMIGNLDCVVIAEAPKISVYRKPIAKLVAKILGAGEDVISVKGKTNEGFGDIGKGDAIAVYAVVLLVKKKGK